MAGKMLVEAAHVDDAGDSGIVVQQYFATWRDEIYSSYWMVEVLGDGQRLHIADPAAAACMDGIAYFVLAL